MKTKVIIGKRYAWSVILPCDGRLKNGLLVSVDDYKMATLMTKDGQEWHICIDDLKPIK